MPPEPATRGAPGPAAIGGPVTIVGAGIVGICAASWLIRDGHDVTVIDADAPGNRCSFGNAGGICPGSVVPMGMPGMWKKVPGWLSDPQGPLFIRLAHLPAALPWMLAFMASGRRDRAEAISAAMAALHSQTIVRYRDLVAWAGCPELLVERGQLFLYESREELEGDGFGLELRRRAGVAMEVLEADALRQLEPALDRRFSHAVFLPGQAQCLNPHRLVQELAAQFVADGGRIERARVERLETRDGMVRRIVTDAGERRIGTLVMAAGAWSGRLLKTAGIHIPLEAERGYHVTVADPERAPRIQAMWARRKFVVTPQEGGLRFAGTDEFAGLDAAPDMRRAQKLLDQGRELIPGLEAESHTMWMGHRPGTPDSLPVLGRDSRYANLLHAFGHGHTGLMGASVSGHVIADLVAGRRPELDLAPYRPDRF